MIGAIIVFGVVAGTDPGFALSASERMLLVVAGTGGVAAFVGVLAVATARSGFRLRPRIVRRDAALGRLLSLSGWGVAAQAGVGILLGGAIVIGGSVAGGVVAYQVAFVFFLAPYAILAQPVNTAVLPELSEDARRGAMGRFGTAMRWALDATVVIVLPVSIAMMVFARPLMDAVSFGEATGRGAQLTGAALAALAAGLLPYSVAFLFTRGYYALDDSRTPAFVALAAAIGGVIVMAAGAALTHGAARVAALGVGHGAAQVVTAVVLGAGLARRLGVRLRPPHLVPSVVLSVVVGLGAWGAVHVLSPGSRVAALATLAAVGATAAVVYVLGLRLLAGPIRPMLRFAGAGADAA
jgi:putative peptidoglycan lipid II flippase